MSGVEYVALTEADEFAFDEYLKATAAKKKSSRAATKQDGIRKTAASVINEALGESNIGQFPSGRIVVRTKKVVNVGPQKARVNEWFELNEQDA